MPEEEWNEDAKSTWVIRVILVTKGAVTWEPLLSGGAVPISYVLPQDHSCSFAFSVKGK